MRSVLRIPSTLSAVPQLAELYLYDKGERLAATISATSSSEAVLLRLDVGFPIVARGDLFDPAWRRWLATDVRLCYSSHLSDRTALLRTLTDLAAQWDSHCRRSLSTDDVLKVAQAVEERLRTRWNGGAA